MEPTENDRPKQPRPLPPVTGVCRWVSLPIPPTSLMPDGLPGLMLINDTVYVVRILGRVPEGGHLVVDGCRVENDQSCPDNIRGWQHQHTVVLADALRRLGTAAPSRHRSASQLAKNDPEAFRRHMESLGDFDGPDDAA